MVKEQRSVNFQFKQTAGRELAGSRRDNAWLCLVLLVQD